ncbi:MAG TPA: zf-HC2 domain-containing protein [Bryobacteraceae bacterium]|nr:zf-HC2 domain-containing protein [Bryobacteraceae bacterium]
MTCSDVQENLSLYVYGELDFTTEEQIEQHLAECAHCRAALEREKLWHQAAHAVPSEVPLDVLSHCRRELHESLEVIRETRQPAWLRWLDSLGFRSNAWSMRIATASLLVCLGFGLSRLTEARGFWVHSPLDGVSEMNVFNPLDAHVRNIQSGDDDRIQIVVDEVREHVITGTRDDVRIRRLLLAASKESIDPAIRLDSLELLKDDGSGDVRTALLYSVRNDPNAGVRLKALQALGQFPPDPEIRETLLSVLAHDRSADVRTQAIDLLAPPRGGLTLTPQLAGALESVMRSDPDGYIRMRCQQALHAPSGSARVY